MSNTDPNPGPRRSLEKDLIGGRYALGSLIGSGTYGEVFHATDDKNPWRRVAIKLLRQEYQAAAVLPRFEDEGVALELLGGHPAIPAIYGRGEWRGRAYIAMEYVEGGSLREYIDAQKTASRSPDLISTVDLWLQICSCIAAAHQLKTPSAIIHRDIKPENILVTKEHDRISVRVLDFGIARICARSRTQRGEVLGSPGYMAPEQSSDDEDRIGPHTDVFALAIVLVEMLTLRRFTLDGRPLSLLSGQVESERAAALTRLRAEVPAALWRIVARGLAADIHARIADAQQFGQAVAAAVRRPYPRAVGFANEADHRVSPSHDVLYVAGSSLLISVVILSVLSAVEWRRKAPLAAPGSMLILGPRIPLGTEQDHFNELCAAAIRVNPTTQCSRGPLRAAADILRWARESGAALIIMQSGADELEIHLRTTPRLLIPDFRLKMRWDASKDPAVSARLAATFGAIAGLAEDAVGFRMPAWQLLAMPVLIGEEATILNAYVRWALAGNSSAGSQGLSDPELDVLQAHARSCLAQLRRPTWSCWMAMFLFGARSDSVEGADMLERMERDQALPARVRQLAVHRRMGFLCRTGRVQEGAALLARQHSITSPLSCAHVEHMDVAACLSGRTEFVQLDAGMQKYLLDLATAPAASFSSCDAAVLTTALGLRGQQLLRTRRWALAERDFSIAYEHYPHESYLINRAESLLHLEARCQEVPMLLSYGVLRQFQGARKLQGAYFRWLATQSDADAGWVLSSYLALTEQQVGVRDPSETLRELVCRDPESRSCTTYRILVKPKESLYQGALERALYSGELARARAAPTTTLICPASDKQLSGGSVRGN